MMLHTYADDNKGSFGDFCTIEDCDCPQVDDEPEEKDDYWADGPYGDV